MSKNGCIHKKTPDGKINPKYVDLLEEDKPISGQKFVCISFVSPENILKQKNQFFFQEFLKHYEFSKSVEKFTQFLNFLSFKYEYNFDDIMKDFQEYMKSEKDTFIHSGELNGIFKKYDGEKSDPKPLDLECGKNKWGQKKHYTKYPKSKPVGFRGPMILWSNLKRLPKFYYPE